MSIGVSKELTKVGIEEEVSEGTFLAPTTDSSYVQPLSDGYEINGQKDLKERNILTEGYFRARPRVGKTSVEWTLNVEAKGSGVEGGQTDYHKLVKSMLGGNRELASRITTGVGHTASVLNIDDLDIGDLKVGDIICVLEAGNHHISPIKELDDTLAAANITLEVAASGAFSDNVQIAKFQTYFGSNTSSDYKTLSIAAYHGDEILEWASGCRPSTMAMSNFTTGELPNFEFSGSGIDFDREDMSAPHPQPVYDDEVPPLALAACVYLDGEIIHVNNFSFSIEHSNGELPSTCAKSGVLSTRKTGKRNVTYSFDPYLDDTDVSTFEKFKNNTPYSLFGFAANPGAVDGEYDLGSIIAFYLPNCISNSDVVGDLDGVNITEIEGTADGGSAGDQEEIFLGII